MGVRRGLGRPAGVPWDWTAGIPGEAEEEEGPARAVPRSCCPSAPGGTSLCADTDSLLLVTRERRVGLSSEAQSCPETGCVPMLGGGCRACARALPRLWVVGSPCPAVGRARGSKEQAGSAPRGLPLPACCAQNHRPEARPAGQAWPSSLKGLLCVALGSAPRLLDSSVSSKNTTLFRGGPPGRVRLDSARGLHPRPRPQPAPCPALRNVHRPRAERQRKAAAAPVLGARRPGPGVSCPDPAEGRGRLTAWARGELQTPISLPASAPPPGSFQKGRESPGRGVGVGAERGLEAEHPNVQGPGPHARRGRHSGGRRPPCSSCCLTVFPPALLLRVPRMLAAPWGREAGRPSPLHTHGWLDMHAHVCLCVCVCACVCVHPCLL